ncbi:hypothetical protein HAX54_010546 [Datura stramonium]|uniref:non-specific serine/threonine protein kinase n=1 Tax=Datura stramonium TaxID=4076 RepID=A0ABS8TGF7_DATST|nr:hypothetical protein [Datura stramonium]
MKIAIRYPQRHKVFKHSLDINFEARVSDFGLAKLAQDANTHVTTRVVGTFGEESLVEWARPLLAHALEKLEFDQLADPRLEKNYVVPEMFQMIEAAAACVRHSAAKRPGMGQIMRAFENMSTSDLTNGMKVGESTIYNSAEQSAEIRLFQGWHLVVQILVCIFSQGTQHSGESAEDKV